MRGAQAHIDAGLLAGADYEAFFDPLYAPWDGVVLQFREAGGGFWIRVTRTDGYRQEFAHLSEYKVENGVPVVCGQRIATTGNTGTITTGPHLHRQIFDPAGNRVDPEKFDPGVPNAMPEDVNEKFENKALVNQSTGIKSFFRGGKNHLFALINAVGEPPKQAPFATAYEQYAFQKQAMFVDAKTFDALPKGTLTAEEVLHGKRDW